MVRARISTKIASLPLSLSIDYDVITPVDIVRDLWCFSRLATHHEIARCNDFRRLPLFSFAATSANSVTSRTGSDDIRDWSWPLLRRGLTAVTGLPESTLASLQRVQNSAIRLIYDLRLQEHVTPGNIQLHCRITYKLCLLMHSIHNGRSPQ